MVTFKLVIQIYLCISHALRSSLSVSTSSRIRSNPIGPIQRPGTRQRCVQICRTVIPFVSTSVFSPGRFLRYNNPVRFFAKPPVLRNIPLPNLQNSDFVAILQKTARRRFCGKTPPPPARYPPLCPLSPLPPGVAPRHHSPPPSPSPSWSCDAVDVGLCRRPPPASAPLPPSPHARATPLSLPCRQRAAATSALPLPPSPPTPHPSPVYISF